MPPIQRLEFTDELTRHLRTIAVQHPRVVGIEQGIFDARKPRALAALDDDGVLAVDDVEDGHAVDRRGGVGLGDGVDHVVGADDQ